MQLSKEKLIDISGELDMKMKCFLHKETLELVTFPDELLVGDFDEDIWKEQLMKIKSREKDYIEIEAMNSTESFRVMEAFTKTVKDKWIASRLLEALEGKKPFAHFNHCIHNMPDQHKKAWFSFKQERMVEFIQKQLNTDCS
jgi:phage pi2 protein 07